MNVGNNFTALKSGIALVLCFISTSCESPTTIPLDPGYTGQKGKITDIEGNSYKTIGIGSQIWMAENLRAIRFNDSSKIQNTTDSLNWSILKSSAYCWYKNDTTKRIPYGALYNWYSVNSGKLCPTGWHIPNADDWSVLINRLGGKMVAGGKLKVIGTDYWVIPNRGATNNSMFNAVPGGANWSGSFFGFKLYCVFAIASETEPESAGSIIPNISLWFNREGIIFDSPVKKNTGTSVRCIKD